MFLSSIPRTPVSCPVAPYDTPKPEPNPKPNPNSNPDPGSVQIGWPSVERPKVTSEPDPEPNPEPEPDPDPKPNAYPEAGVQSRQEWHHGTTGEGEGFGAQCQACGTGAALSRRAPQSTPTLPTCCAGHVMWPSRSAMEGLAKEVHLCKRNAMGGGGASMPTPSPLTAPFQASLPD